MSVDIRAALYGWCSLVKSGEAKSDSVKRLLRYADPDYFHTNAGSILKEKKMVTVDEICLRRPTMDEWYSVFDTLPGKEFIHPYVEKFGLLKTALPKIELMSVHQSKGREAHTVIIDPEMSRAVWTGMIKNPDDEHRVWYVAVTRAQERVYFLLPDGNYSYQF